jgi:hypothetical protein
VALAVCLLFDEAGDLAMRRLWDRLETVGIGTLREHTHCRHRPHLSYTVLQEWDLDAVLETLEDLPAKEPSELTFLGLGTFPRGRGWLAAPVGADLARRQASVDAAVRTTYAAVHPHYAPGMWIAHCTVVPRVRLDDYGLFAAEVYPVLPLPVRVTASAVIDSGTGQTWPLTHIV